MVTENLENNVAKGNIEFHCTTFIHIYYHIINAYLKKDLRLISL